MEIPLSLFSKFARTMSDWHKINQGHDDRVALMAVQIGKELKLTSEQLDVLQCAAEMHDIGRVGLSDELMKKIGALTASDRASIESHSQIGYDLVKDFVPYIPEDVAYAILHHHENWDGSGYPGGLKGEAIPLFARIIAIADRWDALRHDRPYRGALTVENALHIMNLDVMYFDPQLYGIFLKIIKQGKW